MATFLGKPIVGSIFKTNNCLLSVSRLSILSAVQDQLPHFRTAEDNPSLHTYNHVGKFYRIDNSVKVKLFYGGGITKNYDTQMKAFRENCLMIREPYIEILSYLKSMDFSLPAVRFVVYGKNGTGKTSTLAHLLHYGYENKFLLVHVPWVPLWTKRPKEAIASQFKEGMIDTPIQSASWLQHFKAQNAELMEELDLRTSQSYTWSQREITEKGEPLMAVVEHGIQRGRHSSDCIAVLLKEIKILSQSNKFKTMVVIDGANAFFCKVNSTILRRPDRTLIAPKEMTMCNAFMKIVKNDWNNAVIIVSADILPFNRYFEYRDPYYPRVLFGKEGFELVDPCVPVETKNYSEKEIESAIDYYIDRLWIQSEKAKSEAGRKQLKFLSGYNPLSLMEICRSL